MRSAWLVLFACACSGSGAGEPDAAGPIVDAYVDECSRPGPDGTMQGCLPGGLGTVSLDGPAWMLNGTWQNHVNGPEPYSAWKYMKRTGTGRCVFTMATQPITEVEADPHVYVDDTIATYHLAWMWPHTGSASWQLCVRASDGALIYHQHNYSFMPYRDEHIYGVFTRS